MPIPIDPIDAKDENVYNERPVAGTLARKTIAEDHKAQDLLT